MKKKNLLFFIALFMPQLAGAAFYNYNSILIGSRASGMGGAFTALSGDPAACSFYNPATLSRMEGASLSAAVSIYNKYDTQFGDQEEFKDAPLRVNRGSIVPIPVSSGSLYNFKNFALGLSIVFPDFDLYQGVIKSDGDNATIINLRDESLWVGGTVALNPTDQSSVGLTMYYTSKSFSQSLLDRSENAGVNTATNEEKVISNNSLVYILGSYYKLTPNLSVGLSARLPSIPISGEGTLYSSQISDNAPSGPANNQTDILADEKIPTKYTLGFAYEQKHRLSFSFDLSYYGPTEYLDLKDSVGAQRMRYENTWNVNVGGEYYWKNWLALRMGAFTNLSSQQEIPDNPTERYGDHIDMWGFSTNVALVTSNNSTVTLGGYYTGGKGYSSQQIAQQKYVKIDKSIQVFSFLVGTAFSF